MALSKRSLQQKREKKKNKRKTKALTSCAVTEIAYQNWPIHECWIPIELWEKGIGQIIITRKNTQGAIVVGVYLIDTYCLGIKDCFVRRMHAEAYHNLMEHVHDTCGAMELVEPSYAATLIIKAAGYASQFGLRPHSDFSKAKKLLMGIPMDEKQTFTFGQDGKPCYVQGPHESPSDVKRILETLSTNKGNEDCNFLIAAPT